VRGLGRRRRPDPPPPPPRHQTDRAPPRASSRRPPPALRRRAPRACRASAHACSRGADQPALTQQRAAPPTLNSLPTRRPARLRPALPSQHWRTKTSCRRRVFPAPRGRPPRRPPPGPRTRAPRAGAPRHVRSPRCSRPAPLPALPPRPPSGQVRTCLPSNVAAEPLSLRLAALWEQKGSGPRAARRGAHPARA